MDKITRKQYMDGEVTFAQYYSAVADTAGITLKAHSILPRVKAALENGDEHLNTIPLREWDNMVDYASRVLATAFKAHGDFYSLGGGVCVMKQAARNAVESVTI